MDHGIQGQVWVQNSKIGVGVGGSPPVYFLFGAMYYITLLEYGALFDNKNWSMCVIFIHIQNSVVDKS